MPLSSGLLEIWRLRKGALPDRALWGNTRRRTKETILSCTFLCALLNLTHLLSVLASKAAPLSRSVFLTDQTARWQARLHQAVRDPAGLWLALLQVGRMQIKLGMAAFRCDNYGFICKLSLHLMLRDIKISWNAKASQRMMFAASKNMGFSWRRGLSLRTGSDSTALQRHPACSKLASSASKYLHVLTRFRSNMKGLYQRVRKTQS